MKIYRTVCRNSCKKQKRKNKLVGQLWLNCHIETTAHLWAGTVLLGKAIFRWKFCTNEPLRSLFNYSLPSRTICWNQNQIQKKDRKSNFSADMNTGGITFDNYSGSSNCEFLDQFFIGGWYKSLDLNYISQPYFVWPKSLQKNW